MTYFQTNPIHALRLELIKHADQCGADHHPMDTGIDGLSLVRSRMETPLESKVMEPLVCLVLGGEKEAFVNERRVAFQSGDTLIVAMDTPAHSRISRASSDEPYIALALSLDLGIIRNVMDTLDECCEGGGEASLLAVGASCENLVDSFSRLFFLKDRPGSERRVVAPLIKQEIHFRLLQADHASLLRLLSKQSSHASRIQQVLRRIKDCFNQTLDIPELAMDAGMSPSSFHAHFKTITGTTPLQYQKELRLHAARDQLILHAASVSTAAFAVGYESPTQFSREYARKFGHPPSAEKQAAATTASS